MKFHVSSGIDRINEYKKILEDCRVGLMTNPTGVSHDLRSTIDIVNDNFNLTALFACEHGIRGAEQAGGKIENTIDPVTGVPVFSVFGDSKHLSDTMLDTFDVFLFDMQDVGARFYTYLYSLSYAMEACALKGKRVVVLDRVNPIGGLDTEGTILDEKFHSFIGEYSIPTRTGFTMGEYALWVKDHLKLDLDLTVIPLQGWKRDMHLPQIDIPWVTPSPNCPTYDSAMCYIGTCVFESSNVSEGRGTTTPFQTIGAPWINARELTARMNARKIQGVRFRECAFTPTFSKYKGELCFGVQMHITDEYNNRPVLAGLLLMDEIRAMHEDKFELTYGTKLDLLLGTDRYRIGGLSAEELLAEHAPALETFNAEREKFLLYL